MKRVLSVLAVVTTSSIANAAGYETIVTPATPEARTRFGQIVSLDGARLLVGEAAGLKFFEETSGGTWTQSAAIAQPGVDYGAAILRGDWAIINGPSLGLLAVHRTGTSWTPSTTIPDLAYASCGFDGVTLACAVYASGPTLRIYGAASTLSLQTTIADAAIEASGYAGAAVSGSTIAATGRIADMYRTLVYAKSGSTWSRQAVLDDAAEPRGLAMDGNRIAIGLRADNTLRYGAGAVVIYERTGTTWAKTDTLLPPDPVVQGAFGSAVSIVGDRILVGATGAGRFYLYRRVGSSWLVEAGSQSRVGLSASSIELDAVALSSSWIAIGTPKQVVSGLTDAGAVFVYPTTCTSDDNCAPSAHCGSGGTCVTALANGTVCVRSRQCKSGNCVDGYCCDLACDGQCEACDLADKQGSCLPVVDAPHGARPACAKTDGCGTQKCDGSLRGACGAYVGAEVSCREKTCVDGFELSAAVCDGSGSCPISSKRSCDGFTCDGDVCRTTCSSGAECLGGFDCKGGKCVAITELCGERGATVIRRDGTSDDCTPYACRAGACLGQCTASNDCAPGYLCDVDQRCVPRNDAAPSESGGCAFAERGSNGVPFALVTLFGLGAVGRRRRRHR